MTFFLLIILYIIQSYHYDKIYYCSALTLQFSMIITLITPVTLPTAIRYEETRALIC